MIDQICDETLCTGCTACQNSCPCDAIVMESNHEGFYYPTIHESCVSCGHCQSICPMNSFAFSNEVNPTCYAVMADDALRKESSSGAFFPVLAHYVLDHKGVVFGAAFDESMVLRHIAIDSLQDLFRLKGSKYLQSQLGDSYEKVKSFLNENRLVLFTGTPCQVAGLKNFLGETANRNLITVDLICHGVPSQKVYDNYLKSEFPGQTVLNTNFRDKKDGWGGGYITTTTTTTTCTRSLKDSEDSYLQAFFANISLRKSCYNCQFTRLPRPGDFTMADFWGVPEEMDDGKGTSCILVNNTHAKAIFEHIKNRFLKVKTYPVTLPVTAQPQLQRSVSMHPARDDFFSAVDSMPLKETLQKTVYSPKNVGILNFHWENVNFGAVLTSFALNRFLNTNGYYARNIDYVPDFPWIPEEPENPEFDAFRKKYLPATHRVYSKGMLKELNNEFGAFCVGSDQVWRTSFHEFIQDTFEYYFLTFANSDKKLIASAASFGTDDLGVSDAEMERYKRLISRFDVLGIREASGVKICEDMGCPATQVCDPVFLFATRNMDGISRYVSVSRRRNGRCRILYSQRCA